MIAYDDALQRLRGAAHVLATERVPVHAAYGRVLATAATSREALPAFDNSAMDGFALAVGHEPMPAGAVLDILGRRAAGDAPTQASGGAWEIMTGAPLPYGLDAIVPIEQVEILERDDVARPTRIRLLTDVDAGRHVRSAGEDVAPGAELAPGGTRVDIALATLCGAVGLHEVDVRRRPRVGLIATGRELVADPAQSLLPGQIRDSNTPFLRARLAAAGAEVVGAQTVGDDIDAFLGALSTLPDADVVISTGAVSMGRFDFVPDALARVGATTLFHKVAVRPGKPILAARLPSGGLFVGLPGNPASTAVGLRFFVEPLLRELLGMPPETPLRVPLRVPYAKRVPLRMYLKARVALDASSRAGVEVLGGQESFRIRPLIEANAWAVVPADADALAAGDLVDVYGRGHLEPPTLAP